MAEQNAEFALHVHKKAATAKHQDLYTIGIWRGPTLHAICHIQPLDQALVSLRTVLEQAGKPYTSVSPAQRNGVAPGSGRTRLRRLAAAVLASLPSFLKPIR